MFLTLKIKYFTRVGTVKKVLMDLKQNRKMRENIKTKISSK